MKLSILTVIFIVFSPFVNADIKGSGITIIKTIVSFSEYGGGDVVLKTVNTEPSCANGYWLKKSDPGFEVNMSILLSAYHAKSSVILRGHDNQIWGGSSGTYCHLYSIELVQ